MKEFRAGKLTLAEALAAAENALTALPKEAGNTEEAAELAGQIDRLRANVIADYMYRNGFNTDCSGSWYALPPDGRESGTSQNNTGRAGGYAKDITGRTGGLKL